MIDLGSLAQWASAAAAIVAVGISGLSFVRGARKAEMQVAHDRISAVKDQQAGHAERLARVEAELQHLPTKEMVGNLQTSLAYLSGQIEAMNAKSDAQAERTARIESAVEQLVENELRGPRS